MVFKFNVMTRNVDSTFLSSVCPCTHALFSTTPFLAFPLTSPFLFLILLPGGAFVEHWLVASNRTQREGLAPCPVVHTG